jgi:hypothetical protein
MIVKDGQAGTRAWQGVAQIGDNSGHKLPWSFAVS